MGNNEIKLVALDMDGTLLNHQHVISKVNRDTIKLVQDRGISVVLSTGRSILTCGEYADSLGLDSYLVTVNGSEIWGEDRELIERNTLNWRQVQWMWELSQQYQTRYWSIGSEGYWFNEMPNDIQSITWLKFGFDIDDDRNREVILKKLQETGEFELTNSSIKNIEVNPLGVNKANGLKKVCERLGIEMKNVLAIGDSLNDMKMIKESGIGIAMGNAQVVVKQAADWVTTSNQEDGVAKALQKWLLD